MRRDEIITVARRIVSQRNLLKIIANQIQDDPVWTSVWHDAAVAAEGENPDMDHPTVDRCRLIAQIMVILEH